MINGHLDYDPHNVFPTCPSIKVSSIFALPKNSNLLPHQTSLPPIGEPFIELITVDSTNNYAMALAQNGSANHGTVFFAHQQSAGKGQRGKSWTTNAGENLILSLILQPSHLKPIDAFQLSVAVSNACYELFKKYAGAETKIKWPNDIYWRDRKTGGILIENVIRQQEWTYSVVGIGLNINQEVFPEEIKNAGSLKQITGQYYEPVKLAKELCKILDLHYRKIAHQGSSQAIALYNTRLFKLNEKVRLRKGNIVFETQIKGVTGTGKLITTDNLEREFDFGEVEWIL